MKPEELRQQLMNMKNSLTIVRTAHDALEAKENMKNEALIVFEIEAHNLLKRWATKTLESPLAAQADTAIDSLIQELGLLEEAENLLRDLWHNVGPYSDELPMNVRLMIENHFDFDDSE